MVKLIYHGYNRNYSRLLEYIYDKHTDKIDNIIYTNECNANRFNYHLRRYKDKESIKTVLPYDCDITFTECIDEEGIEFQCILKTNTDNGLHQMYHHSLGHEGGEDRMFKTLTLTTTKKEHLLTLVDRANEFIKEKHEILKKSTIDTIRIFYFQKDYWNMLGKAPKRPIETLYLKEGEKEKLLSMVDDFFKPETRELYLSFGMPYKHIVMLYGIPGSGKTSTITSIASYFNCDIYTIPITKELTDYGLIEAFSYVNDKEDKKRIIVLEDIDCIFDNTRKEGDEHNMVTLQAILNCLDGHMCVEGTLLFMTANNPEKMDYALLRSCRIDYKLELGYADEYQTKNIYDTFLPRQSEQFDKFYKKIKHKEFTTAMLQEFLFYNRNCNDILECIPKFIEIIEKNKPCELSSDKKQQNLYM